MVDEEDRDVELSGSESGRLLSRVQDLESPVSVDRESSSETKSELDNDTDNIHYDLPLDLLSDVTIREHNKVVAAIDVDPTGSRFVSAGRDCLKMWDYNGMDSSLTPFRSFEPFPGCVTYGAQYSISGDRILVATSNSQAVIYDRDGLEIVKTTSGDPYIVDMRKTRGHTAALTDCRWHPFKKSEFLTASNDGTVRIWDCARPRVQDKIIVMRSSSSGAKAITTAVTYSCDGKHIISGSTDGGIKFWDTSTSMRASKININAHSQHAHITDLDVLPGETFVYSRATDNTLKMWDTRMYSSPIANVTELYCSNEQTGIYFSPSGDIIVTGTSMNKQNESELSFFRTRDLSKVGNIGFNNCDVVSVCWSNKLNQIYAGLSSGEIKVFYDAHRGSEGITLSINKKIKPKAPGGVGIVGYDLNSCASDPTAQGLRIGSQKNRKSIRARKLEYRPELSSEGSGNTLKIGSNLLAPYIVKSIMEEARRKEDPREAILKYAEVSEKNPYWVSPAYRKNQPKPIFSSVDLDSSDEENVSKKRRK